jgi:hypothetical protein
LTFLATVDTRGFSGVGSRSPGDDCRHSVSEWPDTKLIGHSFVGFFHRFAGNEEPEVRFHLSPGDPQVLGAVRDASALSELSRP